MNGKKMDAHARFRETEYFVTRLFITGKLDSQAHGLDSEVSGTCGMEFCIILAY